MHALTIFVLYTIWDYMGVCVLGAQNGYWLAEPLFYPLDTILVVNRTFRLAWAIYHQKVSCCWLGCMCKTLLWGQTTHQQMQDSLLVLSMECVARWCLSIVVTFSRLKEAWQMQADALPSFDVRENHEVPNTVSSRVPVPHGPTKTSEGGNTNTGMC